MTDEDFDGFVLDYNLAFFDVPFEDVEYRFYLGSIRGINICVGRPGV